MPAGPIKSTGPSRKAVKHGSYCIVHFLVQISVSFFRHKSGGGNGQNLWAIVLSEMRVWDDLCSLWNRVTGSCEKVGNI